MRIPEPPARRDPTIGILAVWRPGSRRSYYQRSILVSALPEEEVREEIQCAVEDLPGDLPVIECRLYAGEEVISATQSRDHSVQVTSRPVVDMGGKGFTWSLQSPATKEIFYSKSYRTCPETTRPLRPIITPKK